MTNYYHRVGDDKTPFSELSPLRRIGDDVMDTATAVLYVHSRIDALQRELAYLLARMAAGEDPNPGIEARDVASRMDDFLRGFRDADNWARPSC